MGAKIRPQRDNSVQTPTDNGFLRLSNSLINKLASNVQPSFAWAYVVLLHAAQYKPCTLGKVALQRGEVLLSDQQLGQLIHLPHSAVRNLKNWLFQNELAASRRVGGKRILQLLKYEQHTMGQHKIPESSDRPCSEKRINSLNW